MRRTLVVAALMCAVVGIAVGTAGARQPGTYPIAEAIAKKLIGKYQTATCQQLAADKQKVPTPTEAAQQEKAVKALKDDPKMKKAFLDTVAGPIANKMFDCGFIP